MSEIKLAIGLPAYGDVIHAAHAQMWLDFGRDLARDPTIMLVAQLRTNVCGVARARNLLLAHAMSAGANWLLMIDSDTWTPDAESLLLMILRGVRAGATIVGAAVVPKGYTARADQLHNVTLDPQVPWSSGPNLVAVKAIGAACIAIDLTRIGDAYFQHTDALSEDLEFCRQIRASGGQIFCDPLVPTCHLDRPTTLSYP